MYAKRKCPQYKRERRLAEAATDRTEGLIQLEEESRDRKARETMKEVQ